jgi:agmatinase
MKAVHLLPCGIFTPAVVAWRFPELAAFNPQDRTQHSLSLDNTKDKIDIVTGSQFNGLRTFANLPYVNCFSDAEAEGKKYDIAIMGAPFDTSVTARPGARYGPGGIRTGSQRMGDMNWSVYTGESTHT